MTVIDQLPSRRSLRPATTPPAAPKPTSLDEKPWDSNERVGFLALRSKWRTGMGYYSPSPIGAPSTTRQVEALNTGLIADPTDAEGIFHGIDLLSNGMFNHDHFTAYNKGLIESINVITIGDVGKAKSALMKTVGVLRQLLLRNRRVCVLDKKFQVNDGEGEYGRLARRIGFEPIRMVIGSGRGGSRLNLLDPALLSDEEGSDGQYRVLHAAAELAQGGKELTAWEGKALRVAHHRALRLAEASERVPTIHDVLKFLGEVDGVDFGVDMRPHARDRFHEDGMTVRFLLDRLCDELEGLFDGPTSRDVKLGEKLTVFDISQLPEDGPALPLTMMLTNQWLLGRIRADPGKQTTELVEEGHHLVGGPAGKVVRSNTKYSRGLALSLWTNIHHISDIPADDPAIAFIREAGTRYIYAQQLSDDADMCERLFSLRPGTSNILQTLPAGEFFVKVGTQAEKRVRHLRSDLEIDLTNTDGAIVGDEQSHR